MQQRWMHGGNERFLIFLKGWKCIFFIWGEQILKASVTSRFYSEPLMPARQGAMTSALFTSPSAVKAGCRRTLVLSSDTEEIPLCPEPAMLAASSVRMQPVEAQRCTAQLGQLPTTGYHSTAWRLPSWLLWEEEKTQREKTDKWGNERSNIYSRAVRQEVWNPGANGNRVAGKTKYGVKYKHRIIHCRLPCNMVSNSIIDHANNLWVQVTVSITLDFCIQLQK